MDVNDNNQSGTLLASAPPKPKPPRRILYKLRRRMVRFIGKDVWVSELASVMFVCVLLVALFSVSFVILKNELAIRGFDHQITDLRADSISIVKEMAEMRERARLISQLDMVVGHRMRGSDALYRVADLIYKNSRQYGYNPELLLAVIAVESRFDPGALGRYRSGNLSGAFGLMQIKVETAQEVANTLGMGKKITTADLFDPETNIILGTAYLTTLIARFKSLKLGIIAYNLGPGTVRVAMSRKEPLPLRYYEKVLTQYYRLKAIGNELDNER